MLTYLVRMDLSFALLDGVFRAEGIIDLGIEAVSKHPTFASLLAFSDHLIPFNLLRAHYGRSAHIARPKFRPPTLLLSSTQLSSAVVFLSSSTCSNSILPPASGASDPQLGQKVRGKAPTISLAPLSWAPSMSPSPVLRPPVTRSSARW